MANPSFPDEGDETTARQFIARRAIYRVQDRIADVIPQWQQKGNVEELNGMPASFQFRLQGLLERRKKEAKEAAEILRQRRTASQEAARTLARAQEKFEDARRLAGDWEQYIREMGSRSRQRAGNWFDSLARARHRLASAAQARLKRETEMAAAEKEVESCHRAVEAARIILEQRVHLQQRTESLRDLQEAEFLRQQELEEMAELAEVAGGLHYLNHALEEEEPRAQMETRTDGQP